MFGRRLRLLREEFDMTQAELAEKLHVTPKTISFYELGQRAANDETKMQMADIFGVTVDYLIGQSNERNFTNGAVKIGVIGEIRAGIPVEAIQDFIDWEEIPDEMAKSGEFFALVVRGDSMEPKMSEGDVVIVRKQSIVENGDIAIVMVNGDSATVKRVKFSNHGMYLIANNPSYDPMFFNQEQIATLPVTIIGKVVELRAKF